MKTLIWILKRISVLAIAVFSTVSIASVISSNRVINNLNRIGAQSSFTDRFTMSFYDLTYFGLNYGIFIFLTFTVAFFAAWSVFKFAKIGRTLVYVVAGTTAIFVMLWAMEQVFFGVPIVGGARDGFGLALQTLAGGIGGFIFARLTSPKPAKAI